MKLRFCIILVLSFLVIGNLQPPPPPPPPPPSFGKPIGGFKEPVSAIGWNGKYFLIGTTEGHVVKYDGKEFLLLENFNTPISSIVWTGNKWLIAGWHLLTSFDGEEFELLGDEYQVTKVECNEEYCVILDDMGRILKYDGKRLEDLFPKIIEALGENFTVIDFGWNEKERFWNIIFNRGTIEYDGKNFVFRRSLPEELINLLESQTVAMEWNGKYWLLGGKKLNRAALFKYDGKTFSEIEYPREIFEISGGEVPPNYVIPSGIAWNGKSFLIDTGYSAIIYDGISFNKMEYITIPYTPYRIEKIFWNGKYFLLWYDLAGTDTSALASFEGSTLNWESFLKGWQWPVISSICWNGEYWLVGFKYIVAEKEMALVRLDEKGIMDLTEEFKKSLLEAPRKTELGFSVLLISIILLAFLERKS